MAVEVTADSATMSEVCAMGRLGARVDRRELPSGDEITVFTVVVDRSERPRPGTRPVTVDAIPCQSARPIVLRRLAAVEPGDVIRIEGTLRRRFWRSGAGLGSALEVDVRRLERVRVRP